MPFKFQGGEGEVMDGKYYRASSAYLGDKTVIEPSGLYEAIDNEGYPIEEKYGGGYHASNILETAASKHKQGAILGAYSMLRYNRKPTKTAYLYEIDDKPDVDISWWDEADFAHLGEVRYRKPVQAKFVGTYTYTPKDREKFNALYRLLDEENPIENEKTYKRLKGKVANIDKYLFNEIPKRIDYSRGKEGKWAQQVVYHGRWSNTETDRGEGVHYGTKQAAKDRLGDIIDTKGTFSDPEEARFILGKPTVGKYKFDDSKIFAAEEPLAEGMMTPDKKGNLREMAIVYRDVDKFRKKLEDEGYKGIAYINEVEHPGSVSYLIWDKSILKELRKPKRVALPYDKIKRRIMVRKPHRESRIPIWYESIKVGKVK